jgi:Uma2 family endonuclease
MNQTATAEPTLITTTNSDALYEVVDGQRVELPPMSVFATWVASRLQSRLGPFAESNDLGTAVSEMLFVLDPERELKRRPDVAFVSSERWPVDREVPDDAAWDVIPDLVIEVISPTDLSKDVLAKVREYFQAGVRLVWVVHPTEQQIYIYESPTRVRILGPSDELDGGAVVPGFRVPVAALFRRGAITGGA